MRESLALLPRLAASTSASDLPAAMRSWRSFAPSCRRTTRLPALAMTTSPIVPRCNAFRREVPSLRQRADGTSHTASFHDEPLTRAAFPASVSARLVNMGGGVASSATNAEDDGGLQLGCRFRYHNADGGGAVHCRGTRRSRSSTRQAQARCQWSLLWLLDPRDRHTRQALAVLDLHAGHQRSG